MILFPAIDLKDGKCVRLLRGDMAKATVFNDSPATQAKAFAQAGCEWLHLVDLNGAVEGHPVNRAAVVEILETVDVPAQLRDGIVAVDGWTKQSTVRALDLALRFEDAGIAAIIYTDIDRDGAMGGVNIDATITLAQHLTTPVIASGGVSSLDDLRELRPAEEHGIVGAIVGRALYDGRVTVPDAIRVLKGE